jgi:hypothetical protein
MSFDVVLKGLFLIPLLLLNASLRPQGEMFLYSFLLVDYCTFYFSELMLTRTSDRTENEQNEESVNFDFTHKKQNCR